MYVYFCKYIDGIVTAIPTNKQNIITEIFNDLENSDFAITYLDVPLLRQPHGKINTM